MITRKSLRSSNLSISNDDQDKSRQNQAEAHQQRWSQTTTSCLRVTKDSSGVGVPSASLSTSGTSVGSMCEPDRKSRQAGQPIERR